MRIKIPHTPPQLLWRRRIVHWLAQCHRAENPSAASPPARPDKRSLPPSNRTRREMPPLPFLRQAARNRAVHSSQVLSLSSPPARKVFSLRHSAFLPQESRRAAPA